MPKLYRATARDEFVETTEEEMCRYVGPGWKSLLLTMFADLFSLGWDGRILQVKQKFGYLRCYLAESTEDIHKIVSNYTSLSGKTCEVCGAFGQVESIGGYYMALCENHYKEKREKR